MNNATADDISSANLILLPYSLDPLRVAINRLLARHSDALPDLGRITVLLPHSYAAARFRQLLLDAANTSGFNALLAPRVMSLSEFIMQGSLASASVHSRELTLVEALRQHNDLYGDSSPWLLAENLFALFDELSLNQVAIPDSYKEFNTLLQHGYGLSRDSVTRVQEYLNHEAKLVFTLWQAWRQQTDADGGIDPQQLYCDKLLNFDIDDCGEHIYLLGYSDLSPVEAHWFRQLANQGKASLIVSGSSGCNAGRHHPDAIIGRLLQHLPDVKQVILPDKSLYSDFLDSVFDESGAAFKARAEAFSAATPASPLNDKLEIFSAINTEQQALGIELQIRQWLHEDIGSIGIISQDRRLSRRLRALLERAGIVLQDNAGWALSTTSAAAMLERWLECIEQDFDHLPMLDLLKSRYMYSAENSHQHLRAVYRLEQDIVLHENIASGLWRYRRQLDYRIERLDEFWTQDVHDIVSQLLDRLEHAAKPLLAIKSKHAVAPVTFLHALRESLQRLDIYEPLSQDAAGSRILDELESMEAALNGRSITMCWSEMRSWLGRSLERCTFRPTSGAGRVQLLDLGNSMLARFDAVIIASADKSHLPGISEPAAFFNDAVRSSLNLPTSSWKSNKQFHSFRCLLESAPRILLSYHTEQNGETILPSPWLEAIKHFHELAYGSDLNANNIDANLATGYQGFVHRDSAHSPATIAARPTATCPATLAAEPLSSSGYQQLVNCPYQFFAARCLKLKAPDVIRTTLEKSDYGNRLHKCLQAFHQQTDDLPPPFGEAITADNRNAAIDRLMQISGHVFARDLEDNFQHRGWLQRWQQLIPDYIDWQARRASDWPFQEAELMCTQNIDDYSISLHGRIDRLDGVDNKYAIIDYKTGGIPSQADIDSGEAVQLPFYAILQGESVEQVEYVTLSDKVESKRVLVKDELGRMVDKHSRRLRTLLAALQQGAKFPAWGDAASCKYCDMDGLCRREAWSAADDGDEHA